MPFKTLVFESNFYLKRKTIAEVFIVIENWYLFTNVYKYLDKNYCFENCFNIQIKRDVK
jgi:hypothetical protein